MYYMNFLSMFHCIVLVLTSFEINVKALLGYFVSLSMPNKYACVKYITPKVFDAYATLNT